MRKDGAEIAKILLLNRLDSVSMANGFHFLEDNNFINNSMVNDNHNRICNNKSNETKATVKSFIDDKCKKKRIIREVLCFSNRTTVQICKSSTK